MLRPSMLDGLHWKLLGNGLWAVVVFAPQPFVAEVLAVSSVVPSGKLPPSTVGFHGFAPWKFTPFDSTVIPAPSRAPISEGSCSSSAMLPFCVASQPTAASSGKRSTCGLLTVALKPNQPVPHEGSHVFGEPSTPKPNRQTTRWRQLVSLVSPAGWVLALMTLEAAPTPCSRTGFHISNISWWAACEWTVVAAVHAALVVGVAAAAQVGSTMSKSPGLAMSIAAWIEPEAATWVGAFPPTVTVTVSIDCWPAAVVMTSSPHWVDVVPEGAYCACCCTAQFGNPLGTIPVIVASDHDTPVRACAKPSAPTRATEHGPMPLVVTVEQLPKP